MPALATGNTAVFKPSEMVPLCGKVIAEIIQGVVPKSVLELVQGEGDVGAALVASDIDMIGFTGSRETGMRIMQSAASGLKRLVLELGGKDPMVVFGDADLDAAAECAVRHSLRNTGQVCCAVERVYIEQDRAAEFEELVVSKAREWREGSGFDEKSAMGPLVSEAQRSIVANQVREAVTDGARLLLGGESSKGPGYFYPADRAGGREPVDADLARGDLRSGGQHHDFLRCGGRGGRARERHSLRFGSERLLRRCRARLPRGREASRGTSRRQPLPRRSAGNPVGRSAPVGLRLPRRHRRSPPVHDAQDDLEASRMRLGTGR